MDNQNANNGGFPQNPNPPENNNQQPTPSRYPNNYENVRTQSVIESAREVAEKELAAQQAYNNQVLKSQQAAARREKGKHAAVKVVLIIFGLVIAVTLIWLIVEVVKLVNTGGSHSDGCVNSDGTISKYCCDREEYKNNASCQVAEDPLPTIDGYKCKNKDCKKMTDIVKNERMLIRDDKYIIYEAKSGATTTTTIDNSIDYTSMSVFEWGSGKFYVILKPATEEYGLYSVESNRQIIPNKITRFYSDINHKAYNGMKDVLGKYIIVRESSQYRLYDIKTGNELASASEGIFTYGKYIMTYHEGEIRHLYNFDSKQIATVNPGEEVYMRSGYAVVFGKSFYIYDDLGNKQGSANNAVYKDLLKQKTSERAEYLKKSKDYYHMPTSRDYSD